MFDVSCSVRIGLLCRYQSHLFLSPPPPNPTQNEANLCGDWNQYRPQSIKGYIAIFVCRHDRGDTLFYQGKWAFSFLVLKCIQSRVLSSKDNVLICRAFKWEREIPQYESWLRHFKRLFTSNFSNELNRHRFPWKVRKPLCVKKVCQKKGDISIMPLWWKKSGDYLFKVHWPRFDRSIWFMYTPNRKQGGNKNVRCLCFTARYQRVPIRNSYNSVTCKVSK